MSKKKQTDKLRDFMESRGIDTAVLDRPKPKVSDLVMDQVDPFGYIGDDAAFLQENFRLSRVSRDQDVERLKTNDFVVLADLDGESKPSTDVRMRGVPGGKIMGRPHDREAVYQAHRYKRMVETRTGTRRNTVRDHTVGGGRHAGRETTTTTRNPASVSGGSD